MQMRSLLVLAVVALAACEKATAPQVDTVTITKTDTLEVFPKWNGRAQVVIESAFGDLNTVLAAKPDIFHKLGFQDFFMATTFVVEQKSMADTMYLGQYYWRGTGGFSSRRTVSWSLSGSMEPANNTPAKIGLGDVNSFYMLSGWDDAGEYVETFGFHKTVRVGSDFQLSSQFEANSTTVYLDNIYYRPIVCTDYGTRTFDSKTMTETFGDSARKQDFKMKSTVVKITCNPIMSASASKAAPPPPVRVTDFIRAGRKLEQE